MLIHKDGIYRNVDSRDLQKYEAKGYVPIERTAQATPKAPKAASQEEPKK